MAGSGETVTYRQLDEQSNRIAQLFRSLGLKAGDHIALFLENNPRFFEICWGAQRSGLIYTAISSRLTAAEVDYIVSRLRRQAVRHLEIPCRPGGRTRAAAQGCREALHDRRHDRGLRSPGKRRWRAFPQRRSPTRSRATTCSIRRAPPGGPRACCRWSSRRRSTSTIRCWPITRKLYGMDENTIYLSPAPLYHAAPLRFNMSVMRLGGTSVIMEHFDAEEFLRLVGKYKITHTQLVPTMFVRFLKLPDEVRLKYDVSSLRCAIHAAAPCPIPVKEKMIDWWGPIVWEYYGGTEGNGLTLCNAAGMDGAQGHGRPRRRRHAQDLRRGRQRAAGGRAGHRLLRRRAAVRVPQRSREDRRVAPTPRVGRRWATWATSMPTASCT